MAHKLHSVNLLIKNKYEKDSSINIDFTNELIKERTKEYQRLNGIASNLEKLFFALDKNSHDVVIDNDNLERLKMGIKTLLCCFELSALRYNFKILLRRT